MLESVSKRASSHMDLVLWWGLNRIGELGDWSNRRQRSA